MPNEQLNGLQRSKYLYVADDGKTYTISMRDVYAAASRLTKYTNQANQGPFPGKPRHAWIVAKDNTSPGAAGKAPLRRKVPFGQAALATAGQGLSPGATVTGIDNLSWLVEGHVGEKVRYKP